MQNYTSKKEYPLIDVMKFVASLLVVAIHVPLFGSSSTFDECNFYFRQIFTRVAVPFFFISSGYFFFRKIKNSNIHNSSNRKMTTGRYVFIYLKKLFRMYLLWTLVYMFFIVKSILHGRKTVLMTIRDFLFVGSYLHLWYLLALIVAIAIASLLIYKKIKTKNILIISFIFYLIGLLGQSYNVIFKLFEKIPYLGIAVSAVGYYFRAIFYTTRGGLFEGFFFVSLGLVLAEGKVDLSVAKKYIGLIISIVLYILEVIFVKHFGWGLEEDTYIMLIPVAFFVFYIGITSNVELKKINCVLLRKLSTMVFYVHLAVFAIYKDIVAKTGGIFSETESIYIQVTVITVIISFLFIKISENKGFKWLKYFYM